MDKAFENTTMPVFFISSIKGSPSSKYEVGYVFAWIIENGLWLIILAICCLSSKPKPVNTSDTNARSMSDHSFWQLLANVPKSTAFWIIMPSDFSTPRKSLTSFIAISLVYIF